MISRKNSFLYHMDVSLKPSGDALHGQFDWTLSARKFLLPPYRAAHKPSTSQQIPIWANGSVLRPTKSQKCSSERYGSEGGWSDWLINSSATVRLLYGDLDGIAHRRTIRPVRTIAKLQGQLVFSWRKGERAIGLTLAVMQMHGIHRDSYTLCN